MDPPFIDIETNLMGLWTHFHLKKFHFTFLVFVKVKEIECTHAKGLKITVINIVLRCTFVTF